VIATALVVVVCPVPLRLAQELFMGAEPALSGIENEKTLLESGAQCKISTLAVGITKHRKRSLRTLPRGLRNLEVSP